MLQPGLSYSQSITVELKDTAAVYGSGKLNVFATPAMIALMENTAMKCIENELESGKDSVGIEINAKHIKATAVGKNVHCRATVTEVDGRRIRFELEAHDESGVIGTATHDRFIIDPVKFMSKL
ncbi:thioesterase family protein [Odoribacter lunatus]|uniref:thioesterase family protein n=1 Tax=Odoribacter lunatus TaxID=2941335 RepID=UPI00203EA90E|nr:thioesterase family protein [Odoribacter lunatus]